MNKYEAADPVFEPAPSGYSAGSCRQTDIQGAVTRYWEYGDPAGDPLVLIHGFRGDHHGLELIAHGLQNFRVIIPDLPGFGKSEPLPQAEHSLCTYASWLVDFLNLIPGQPGQVHLVGHSFGSIICSYTANAVPGLVHEVSLINPISQLALEGPQKLVTKLAELYYRAGARLPEPLGFSLLRSAAITRVSSEFMMKNSDPLLRRFINGQHRAYFGAFASRQAVLEAYRASTSSTAAEYIGGVLEPVQMIVADKDDLGTAQTQQAMYRRISRGRYDLIPQVGHLIHYETPLYAARLITDFHRENRS